MSPLSWRIQNMNKTWSYFYKQDWEYRVLEIEGNRNFKKIEEHKSIWNKPISWKIKNMNEKREYFYTKNWEYKVFDLNGYKEFDDIYIYYKNTDINGKPIKGVAKLNWKRKSFDFNPSFIEKLFSKGTDVKRLS